MIKKNHQIAASQALHIKPLNTDLTKPSPNLFNKHNIIHAFIHILLIPYIKVRNTSSKKGNLVIFVPSPFFPLCVLLKYFYGYFVVVIVGLFVLFLVVLFLFHFVSWL